MAIITQWFRRVFPVSQTQPVAPSPRALPAPTRVSRPVDFDDMLRAMGCDL
ncbi:hypothetical protein [Deinococcus sonorensis]|uniref:Uncharacterized protein n=1 Tax=Deinococcus sonorensis TaxID=309891 RepID=A0ABV8YCT0_9DEIO